MVSSWEYLQILICRALPQSNLDGLHTVVTEEQRYQSIVLDIKKKMKQEDE